MVEYIVFNDLINYKIKELKGNIYIFDIDNTLYSFNIPYLDHLCQAITNYMWENKNIVVKKGYLDILGEKYGTYILGIIKEYNLKKQEIDEILMSCEILKILKIDTVLLNYLKQLQGRLWCFTNGPKIHAKNILSLLQIEQIFEIILYADYFRPLILKPNPIIYEYIEQSLNIKNSKQIHFFDDSPGNIKVARKRKWNAYLISKNISLIDYLKTLLN